ncbi:hypothetical protein CC2G_014762 [Coprinopsis cinerea AmutBmut pab1-1]|nr:hypothetical protein CC2G_014762 [Coprinopsis cinerea AmutBmut pab1-1]
MHGMRLSTAQDVYSPLSSHRLQLVVWVLGCLPRTTVTAFCQFLSPILCQVPQQTAVWAVAIRCGERNEYSVSPCYMREPAGQEFHDGDLPQTLQCTGNVSGFWLLGFT